MTAGSHSVGLVPTVRPYRTPKHLLSKQLTPFKELKLTARRHVRCHVRWWTTAGCAPRPCPVRGVGRAPPPTTTAGAASTNTSKTPRQATWARGPRRPAARPCPSRSPHTAGAFSPTLNSFTHVGVSSRKLAHCTSSCACLRALPSQRMSGVFVLGSNEGRPCTRLVLLASEVLTGRRRLATTEAWPCGYTSWLSSTMRARADW